MIYVEITNKDQGFVEFELSHILLGIRGYVKKISWSLQLILAAGDIERIVEMNMLTLEEKCKTSNSGFLLPFETLVKLSEACDDIVDILIVGCLNPREIPKAYSDAEWEKQCDIII